MDCLKDCNGACCKWLLVKGEFNILWKMRRAKDLGNGIIAIPALCIFFKDGLCTKHTIKPDECKAYQAGNEMCHKCRQAEGLSQPSE